LSLSASALEDGRAAELIEVEEMVPVVENVGDAAGAGNSSTGRNVRNFFEGGDS
jgi:hypothetical protein